MYWQDLPSDAEILSRQEEGRHFVADHVRLWGTSASIALLDPACKIFSLNGLRGVIGYRQQLGCAIVFGDPVCPPANLSTLTFAFHDYCKKRNWKVIYSVASQQFSHWALGNVCQSSIEFGQELILDPSHNPKEGAVGRKLRNKLSHATHAGVEVEEYLPQNEHLEYEMTQVARSWLDARKGPQIYLAPIDLFAHREGKRWFYAQQQDQIVGVLLLDRLHARQGWLFNLLLTHPTAPHGTSELLVIKALENLKAEECRFATCGAFPGDALGNITGLGPLSTWMAHKGFKLAKQFFHLNSRKTYWKKFHPQSESSFLLFSEPRITMRQSLALIRSLNASI